MKSIWLTAVAGFLIFSGAKAQSNLNESKIGLGVEGAFPMGSYRDVADYGIGVSLLYQKPLNRHLSITGNVGYLRFKGPAVFSGIDFKEGYVPIKAGARYFIVRQVFFTGDLGVAIPTASGYGSGTAFIYTPGLGTEFQVAGKGSVDLTIKYDSWARRDNTRSFAGIRVGYNF